MRRSRARENKLVSIHYIIYVRQKIKLSIFQTNIFYIIFLWFCKENYKLTLNVASNLHLCRESCRKVETLENCSPKTCLNNRLNSYGKCVWQMACTNGATPLRFTRPGEVKAVILLLLINTLSPNFPSESLNCSHD